RITVVCVDLDEQGNGLGELDGRRVHVPGALPGERVAALVEDLSRQSHAAWTRLLSIEAASPAPQAPARRAFGACGGCVLQPLAYEAQLDWKRRRVAEALAGQASLSDVSIDACVPSPRQLGYRNKSKLVATRVADDDRLVLGAYAPRSHQV